VNGGAGKSEEKSIPDATIANANERKA